MLRHAAVPCVCLLLLAFPATSARAQWQTLPVVDELTSKQAVVALAEGAHGHMRMRGPPRGAHARCPPTPDSSPSS